MSNYTQWGGLFPKFREEIFPTLPILIDIVDDEDKDVYVFPNIRISNLHNVATIPTTFPCTSITKGEFTKFMDETFAMR